MDKTSQCWARAIMSGITASSWRRFRPQFEEPILPWKERDFKYQAPHTKDAIFEYMLNTPKRDISTSNILKRIYKEDLLSLHVYQSFKIRKKAMCF